MSLPRFHFFDVRELESIAPLFREERCGIYILEFSAIQECDLDKVEKTTIQRQRALGHRLRNKTWNFDFAGSSIR